MQQQPSNQQTIINDQFIVKVKLLSNEVYEFTIDPQRTKVSDLKRMILEKINIPLDKQRIIFGAKQLIDDSKVTDYVKESGLTVHLIARMGGQETTTGQNNSNNTQSTTQHSSNQQQNTNNTQSPQQTQPPNQQNNINSNPLGAFFRGMGGLGANVPQATTMTFSNVADLGSSLGGLLGSFGIRLPPPPLTQPTQSRPATQNVNNPFQTPPTNTQRQAQQSQQPTSSFNLNPPQQQQVQPSSQQQNTHFHVSNEPILRLNETITTLNLPAEPVLGNQHLSLREQTAQYLRRLQHQYMRMIPQLNRTVQLLNEGRVSHLSEVLRLFEAINFANQHAQESIRRLMNLPANQTQQQNSSLVQQQNLGTGLQGVQIQVEEDLMQTELDMNQGLNNVQATIIIQENQIDDTIDEEPTILPNQSSQQPQQQQVVTGTINLGNLGGGLSNLLQGLTQPMNQGQQQSTQQQQPQNIMGGLNIGGLMSMLGGMGMNLPQQAPQLNVPQQRPNIQPSQAQQQQTTNQPTTLQSPHQPPQQAPHVHGPGCNHHHQPPQQQAPQQFPQIGLNNLASMASMFLNPQQQRPTQQQSSTQLQQQQNPMGGLMGIFSSLQQSGGMGELLGTSLGETLEEGLNEPTIYSTILKSIAGSDLLACFTSKNFEFLDRKYQVVRQNFLNAISIAGSQEQLIEQVSSDIANLIIPKHNVTNYETCLQQVRTIVNRHFQEIVRITLNRGDFRYSEKLTSSMKTVFCEAIEKVVSSVNSHTLANGQSATHLVFQNLKVNAIQLMDEFIQGLSGMFYGFIERDLIRIYNEYREEQKRKQSRSTQQIASEEELLKQIEIESKKDIDYLKNFKHSQFYHPKAE